MSPTTPAEASTSSSACGGWYGAHLVVVPVTEAVSEDRRIAPEVVHLAEPLDPLEDRVVPVLRFDLLDHHR